VNQQTTLFSNEKLMAMIIPLFLEQLLIMLVGTHWWSATQEKRQYPVFHW